MTTLAVIATYWAGQSGRPFCQRPAKVERWRAACRRSAVGLAEFQEVRISAELLEGEVERHGDRPEVARRLPAAVGGVEQDDVVALAGRPQARQRHAGAPGDQAVAVGAEAHQYPPAPGERAAADALEDGRVGGHGDGSRSRRLGWWSSTSSASDRCPRPPFPSRPSWPP